MLLGWHVVVVTYEIKILNWYIIPALPLEFPVHIPFCDSLTPQQTWSPHQSPIMITELVVLLQKVFSCMLMLRAPLQPIDRTDPTIKDDRVWWTYQSLTNRSSSLKMNFMVSSYLLLDTQNHLSNNVSRACPLLFLLWCSWPQDVALLLLLSSTLSLPVLLYLRLELRLLLLLASFLPQDSSLASHLPQVMNSLSVKTKFPTQTNMYRIGSCWCCCHPHQCSLAQESLAGKGNCGSKHFVSSGRNTKKRIRMETTYFNEINHTSMCT